MERLQKFLRTYLITALLYALLGILDSILQWLKYSTPGYTSFLSILTLLFFFFNMVALAIFVKTKQERLTWVLPTYHLALYVLFFIIGVTTATVANKGALFLGMSIFGLVSSLAELGFGLYMIRKFKFI